MQPNTDQLLASLQEAIQVGTRILATGEFDPDALHEALERWRSTRDDAQEEVPTLRPLHVHDVSCDGCN